MVADFLQGQRIHIRAQPDRLARSLPLDDCHNARGCNPLVNIRNPKFTQPRNDKSRGFVAIKG